MVDKTSDAIHIQRDSLFEFAINNDFGISIDINGYLVTLIFIFIICCLAWRFIDFFRTNSLEIDETEFGIGNQKIKLRPNNVDVQIAYKIWIELSTRKIGIPIDIKEDVIVEIYNSWHRFFGVTRELIKEIPATKLKRKETREIIIISISILNKGVRPHLTSWQAKFRHWYDKELKEVENYSQSPQEIQNKYSEYEDLTNNLLEVNKKLIEYKKIMYQLAFGRKPETREEINDG